MGAVGRLAALVRGSARYSKVAPLYDLLSAEPVYRPGRVVGIEALRLSPGDQVLDLGCGTGLNFSLLHAAVGPTGRIVGVDASPEMLAQARRRAVQQGWHNVTLLQADATSLHVGQVARSLDEGQADAVVATYALSLMPQWRRAWTAAGELARPGARMAVVDMRPPMRWWLAPPARLAMRLGGADPTAEPWTAVEAECREVVTASLRGGHVQVRAGTLPQ